MSTSSESTIEENSVSTESFTSNKAEIRKPLSNFRLWVDHLMGEYKCSEITITFTDKWRKQFDEDDIRYLLVRWFRAIPLDINMVLLLPEYGKNMNIHYHGLISGNHKNLAKMKQFLNHRLGRRTISVIRMVEQYKDYR